MADGSHQQESNQLRAPGGSEPHRKHSLAVLGILGCLPSFSALCPGSPVSKTAPSGLSLHSLFRLGLVKSRR